MPTALEDLLATKVSPPRVRAEHLSRPRLLDRLTQASDRELLLVTSPAGFGKTTLLATWAQTSNRPVAWLSLDQHDSDPARFWRYVIAALDRVDASIGTRTQPLLGGASQPPAAAIVTALVNALADRPSDIVLVLDDYHAVDSPAVHDSVALLVDHMPPSLHLLIASRGEPPLPIARLRARGQLAEITAAELRFVPREVDAFFTDVWGITLPAEALDTLAERTEGWVAGLQLAALSLRQQLDPTQFIAGFSGSDRFVLDYLSEEVLVRQPPDVREFLLHTAVLERLSGPLCDSLTGQQHGQAMLETLERASLFVVPLDNQRQWYRYHHLFADLLRDRLRRERPELVAELHRRAAAWYESNALFGDAVQHALAADDPLSAARLVETCMEDLIWWRGESETLARWLAALPEHVVTTRPRLLLAQALQALVAGRLEAASSLVAQAELVLAGSEAEPYVPTLGRTRSVLANLPAAVAFIRANLACQRGEASSARAFAVRAIDHLTPEDAQLRAVVQPVPGEAAWLAGDLTEAETILEQAIADRQADGQPQMATRPLSLLGQVQQARGHLRAAAQTYRRGLEMIGAAGPRLPSLGLQHVGLAEVLRQQGDLEAASHHVSEGIELCRLLASTQQLANGLATLAWIHEARGDTAAAEATMAEALANAAQTDLVPLLNPLPSEHARLLLRHNRPGEVASWLAERAVHETDEPSYAREREYFVLARLLLARDAGDRAVPLLERIRGAALAADRVGGVIEANALLALAPAAAPRGFDRLADALALAAPEGHVAVFANDGQPMAALLRRFVSAGQRGRHRATDPAVVDYAKRLLTHFPRERTQLLTPREREVLRLLAAGKANREIAQQLVVTLDTVKKHLSHVLDKLGATSRTHAVARARELGLL